MFTQPSKKFAKLKTVYVCSRMIRLATQLTPTIFKINSAVRSVIANILSMTWRDALMTNSVLSVLLPMNFNKQSIYSVKSAWMPTRLVRTLTSRVMKLIRTETALTTSKMRLTVSSKSVLNWLVRSVVLMTWMLKEAAKLTKCQRDFNASITKLLAALQELMIWTKLLRWSLTISEPSKRLSFSVNVNCKELVIATPSCLMMSSAWDAWMISNKLKTVSSEKN